MLFKKAIVFWNDGCKRLIHPNRRKMLLLLHGLSSDATSYMRFTSIERYAEAHQLAEKAIVFWNDGCKRLIHPNRR
jgi:poly(3-hydroxybutyrate) depolymerase